MGSRELYIQPILEENLSVVPGMSEAINTMTAQLNETTRILMNMMSNQGLELHQQAYNGSAFSALTLSIDRTFPWEKKVCNFTCVTVENDTVSTTEIASKTINTSDGHHGVFSWIPEAPYYNILADVSKIKFFASVAGRNITGITMTYFNDTWKNKTGVLITGGAEFEIDDDIRGATAINFTVQCYDGGSGNIVIKIQNPVFEHTDNTEETIDFVLYPQPIFNSANAITLEQYAGIANSYNGVFAKKYLTLPDIINVGSWATFLINGNIDGVALALVDDTSHELLVPLSAATSDISSLTQTSNLALSVTMTAPTQVINSIAQRYY